MGHLTKTYIPTYSTFSDLIMCYNQHYEKINCLIQKFYLAHLHFATQLFWIIFSRYIAFLRKYGIVDVNDRRFNIHENMCTILSQ